MIHHAPSVLPPVRRPVVWIWIWVLIGFLCLVGMFMILVLSDALNRFEIRRFEACRAGTENDCRSSIYWDWNGLSLPPSKTVSPSETVKKDGILPNGLIQSPTQKKP